MILSLLFTQFVPVSLPELDLARVCARETVCIEREANAYTRLESSWMNFPVTAQSACAVRAEQGDITLYSRLEACLIIQQVTAPRASEQRNTSARIELRPASAGQ